MPKNLSNTAYIDGANLDKGSKALGVEIDYKKLKTWLEFKYGVTDAYIFIGMIREYKDLYNYLQDCGFKLIFKEVVYDNRGKPKGNCDADLVLNVVSDVYENKVDNVILVSSDGDYAGMVKFLLKKKVMRAILSPSAIRRCSVLLRRTGAKIVCLEDIQCRIQKE